MLTMTLWNTAAVSLAIAALAIAAPGIEGAEALRKPTGPVPWAIDTRPMPQGTNLQALLPRRVGDFTRDELPESTQLKSDEDIVVKYRSARESVDVGLSRPDSAAEAHDAIEVTRDEARRSGVSLRGEKRSVGTEPSYFTAGDFASWSRDRYFFFVKARSPETLDRFMRSFPF
jgi:hypothetical protein